MSAFPVRNERMEWNTASTWECNDFGQRCFMFLVFLAVSGLRVEMTCSFFGITMPAVAAPPSCFLSSLLYGDRVVSRRGQEPADCPMPL